MSDDEYWDSDYYMKSGCGTDMLILSKHDRTNWCHLKMETNGNENGMIDIRSKKEAEMLHYMLGQMLGK